MSQDAGRILALEAMLIESQGSLMAHDVLLRALLTHLGMTDPAAIGSLARAVAAADGPAIPEAARREVREMLEDIADALGRR